MMQQLRSTQDKALHLVLEGEEVIFHYLGKYEDHKWYSMTIWGPSEGPSPIVGFQTLTEEEAIKKVLHHYYFNWNTISMRNSFVACWDGIYVTMMIKSRDDYNTAGRHPIWQNWT